LGIPERRRSFERPTREWENNIKRYLKEIELEEVNWMYLAQDRD
jgi:hypothetical protein